MNPWHVFVLIVQWIVAIVGGVGVGFLLVWFLLSLLGGILDA